MSQAVEFARAPLKPHLDLLNPEGEGYKTLSRAMKIIEAWPGCENFYYGIEEVGGEEYLRLFVDWESVDVHKSARQDP
jgi:hypothetical protein